MKKTEQTHSSISKFKLTNSTILESERVFTLPLEKRRDIFLQRPI